MNTAEYVVLLCFLSQSSAASLLPDVIYNLSDEPTEQPLSDPEINKPLVEGPLNYNDVDDEHTRLVLIYHWCISYKYCTKTDKEPEEMSAEDIKKEMCTPIKAIKEFYKLDYSDCELTKELLDIMSQPRCSREDLKHSCQGEKCTRRKRWARLGSIIWKLNPVTYSVKNFLSSSSLSAADQEAIARFCSKLWTDNSGLNMQFLPQSQANIEIMFEYMDGPYGTVGKGLSPSYRGSSYLKLDSAEQWKKNINDYGHGVSLQWALCHEMGHNLGLGHSGDSNAIMYPSGVGQDDSRLSSDDLQGIQALYGGPGNKQPSYPAPSPPPPPPPPTYRTYQPTYSPPPPPPPQPTYRTYQPTYSPPPPPPPQTYRAYPQTYKPPPPQPAPYYPAPSPRPAPSTTYRYYPTQTTHRTYTPRYAPTGHVPRPNPQSPSRMSYADWQSRYRYYYPY